MSYPRPSARTGSVSEGLFSARAFWGGRIYVGPLPSIDVADALLSPPRDLGTPEILEGTLLAA